MSPLIECFGELVDNISGAFDRLMAAQKTVGNQ